MVANRRVLGYQEGHSFLYQLSGSSKLFFFLLVSVSAMVTYDTRLIIGIAIGSLILFHLSGIRWKEVSFALTFIGVFLLLNLVTIYLFSPEYGVELYGSRTLILQGWGSYTLTVEQAFYLFNLLLKYFCTVPLAILFLLTTHPSQFAASLNQVGVNYKVAYAVSLALRYVPDLQEEYQMIKNSQEARGIELSPKARLSERIKGNIQIILPLIFSSLDRIDIISTAMELRRFGKNDRRTWYMQTPLSKADKLTLMMGGGVVVLTVLLFFLNRGRFYNPFLPLGEQ